MSTIVAAPVAGRLIAMREVNDPVFATELIGPGVGIAPDDGETDVVAPVAGRLVEVYPHMFIVESDEGGRVLVHLGIDTYKLHGVGFTVVAEQGDEVEQGTSIVRWNPGDIAAHGEEATVLVIAADREPGALPAPASGTRVERGTELYRLEATA